MAGQVRVLQLNPDENLENKLYRLQKGWVLHFTLSPFLQPYNVHLFCNHPPTGQQFDRQKYYELNWVCPPKAKCDNGDRYSELKVHQAGAFHFYLTYDDGEKDKSDKQHRTSGYFTVDPTLHINNKQTLPLDCISLQTVLSKCLGPLSQWMDRLQVGKESGYNIIHFTPIQELGESNSSYSLFDQLELNHIFNEPGGTKKVTFDDVKNVIEKMKSNWGVLSIVDIVLNHTASNSKWLWEHPECAYNVDNSPHLRPAFLLDRLLWHFSCDVADGKYADRGIPPEVNNEHHVHLIGEVLRNELIPSLNLWEFYCVDVDKMVGKFKQAVLKSKKPPLSPTKLKPVDLKVSPSLTYERNSAMVNIESAVQMFKTERTGATSEKERLQQCCNAFREHLITLNEDIKFNGVFSHVDAAINHIQSNIRYERLQENGPKHSRVTQKDPLVTRCFTIPGDTTTIEEDEKIMNSSESKFCMANQGWIWSGDPLKDFAAPDSNAYLRREVIAWGDSVKLRYGEKPEDAPFLWDHMLQYAKQCARLCAGVRLDNCHSTPLHVAEYMLDAARKENPELYVVAELFTGSELLDNIFVNRLGITSLIREAMSAHDAHEEGRLIYRYGGDPVGAFLDPLATKPFVPAIAHALYMDITHDNENPIKVRSVYDSIASAALVSMACCASGSSRGYDELVPHHIHVVKEERLYESWPNKASKLPGNASLSPSSGILSAKRAINQLHKRLGQEGYSQVYVDQIHADVHAITRHCPDKRKTVVLVAHSAFKPPPDHLLQTQSNMKVEMHGIPPLSIPGDIVEVIFEAMLFKKENVKEFEMDDQYINGLQSHEVLMQENVGIGQAKTCRIIRQEGANMCEVFFDHFSPGSVIAFQVVMEPKVSKALGQLRSLSCELYGNHTGNQESAASVKELNAILSNLSLCDLNRVLYRCHNEEEDDGKGGGVYDIPDYGSLTYCGLQGFLSVLTEVRQNNDLAHPICKNLREGNWMMDYVVNRLMSFHGTNPLAVWLDKAFSLVKECPRYLVPCYFDAIITPLYLMVLKRTWAHMSEFVKDGSTFVKALSLCSVQFIGLTRSANLPTLSPSLCHGPGTGSDLPTLMSMAAGLPHFSTGFMRCWGRDTFISLRGLMLTTGRYADARHHILAFAGCLRHGLIPNLLDRGTNPRYNCRDAVWWWLQSIQEYCKIVPHGLDILKDPVSRIFLTDSSEAMAAAKEEKPLHDIMQEAIQRHFNGVQFRERGAGPSLDINMSNQGFNVSIAVDERTGFVFGGNEWNSGTWMDKVGDSHLAGNAGVPATPRDGSAVEIIGLCKSTVRWLAELSDSNKFPYSGVSKLQDGFPVAWTYKQWDARLAFSFEDHFWVAESPNPSLEGEEGPLVHRRGIYKDSVRASHTFTNYQLRPNFCVAMTVAPELFNPDHAWKALDAIENILLGPLGVATLDPQDWAYDGIYDNGTDSTLFKSSKGFSYHQGPEWVWCIGAFIRARLHFARIVKGKDGLAQTITKVRRILAYHKDHINASPWKSIPELTNAGGEPCRDSCLAQAWSIACILDVLYDLENYFKD